MHNDPRSPQYKMSMRVVLLSCITILVPIILAAEPLNVPKEHPYLLGTRTQLQALAEARPDEFKRVQAVAQDASVPPYWRGMSLALVAAINDDKDAARDAQKLAMKIVNAPVRVGHVTFGTDLAL